MLGLTVGAFLLASWVDARIADKRPDALKRQVGYLLAGLLVLEGTVGVLGFIESSTGSLAAVMAGVLTLFLPALVYSFLTGMWLMRTLAGATGLAR
ncbi:MAG: hypothetical protein H0W90_09020 [Actinobacteria bacterium]|nr:hypothetical protein [Actinomycetota bacterium]